MKLHNATHEDCRTMVDSKVYVIKAGGSLTIPDWPPAIAKMVAAACAKKGVFVHNDNEEGFEAKKRDALKKYSDTTLSTRVNNYLANMDERRGAGKTVIEGLEFKTAQRWQGEIAQLLGTDAAYMEATSFLPPAKSVVANANKPGQAQQSQQQTQQSNARG